MQILNGWQVRGKMLKQTATDDGDEFNGEIYSTQIDLIELSRAWQT